MQQTVSTNLSTIAMKSHIQMAENGHFPLFEANWLGQISLQDIINTNLDNQIIEEVAGIISKHQSIERQKIVFDKLDHNKKKKFINSFLKKVFYSQLDKRTELQ